MVLRMPTDQLVMLPTGLSPSVVPPSNGFGWNGLMCCWSYNPAASEEATVWADPGSLATTTGLSLDFSSSSY